MPATGRLRPRCDRAGGSIGRVGGPETPLSLSVQAGGDEGDSGGRPWYKRWYVYAGGAAVLGLAAGAFFLTSGGEPGDGSLDPGRITLSP